MTLLGENFFAYLMLAFGAAAVIGPTYAFFKPPNNRKPEDLEKPPIVRTLSQIFVGSAISIWALATLFS